MVMAGIGKPLKEALYGFAGVEPAEVVGAEVCIFNAVGEHVLHDGEHRSGNGEDGFLGAASCLDSQELGLQIGVFHPNSVPCGGNERGFRPRAAFAYTGAAAFAGAPSLRGQRPYGQR